MMHVEVVCALITNDKGETFCCKRGSGGALEGKWEFPGGKIEKGENPKEAIAREIREELKTEINVEKYLGITYHEYHFEDSSLDFSIRMQAYQCSIKSGVLTLSEHTEEKWATLDEMKKMDFADADKPFIKEYNLDFGFLRETDADAKKAGIDPDTGINRTGLESYLKEIYPSTSDWVHDKPFSEINGCRKRPDYKSPSLKIIVEFDGIQHYQEPDKIKKDEDNKTFYEENGYTVIRIPYFIQLSKKTVKQLFNVDMKKELFNDLIPSLGPLGHNCPAYLCPQGIKRMAKEFLNFPEQMKTNLEFLKAQPKELNYLMDYELLEREIDLIKNEE